MGPLSFWAQRRWKVDVMKKRDLNGMEGHGKGQKRGLGLGQDEGTTGRSRGNKTKSESL